MIDAAHAWAPTTMNGIHQRLHKLAIVGSSFGFTICKAPPFSHSPNSYIIQILWAVSSYTNQVSLSISCLPYEDNNITFITAHILQTAVSAYFQWYRLL